MSPERPNELEERRVIRLLAGAAETVPPLHDVEVETLIRLAAVPPASPARRRRIIPRRSHLLPAAAAACVLAAVLPMRQPESPRPSPSSSGLAAHTVAFPEGSALSLLLSPPAEQPA